MLNLNWDIIWTFVNILILFVLLKLFLFKPVNAMMEKRRKLIDGQLSDAAQKQKEAEAEKQAYADRLKEAHAEAAEILKKAKAEAEAQYCMILERAERDAQKKTAEAGKKIALEHEQMRKNAKSEIAAVAVMAEQKLAVKHADAEVDSALLESLIQEAGAMK